MGSRKFLISILLFFIGVYMHAEIFPIEDGHFFVNKTELKEWAKKHFHGGINEIKEFSKEGKKIIVLNASITIGLLTSYLRIYVLTPKGLELILVREKIDGNVMIIEKDDNLIFVNNNLSEKILFILPWDGIFSNTSQYFK